MKLILLTLFSALALGATCQTVLPDNMYADSAHAPFLWGVASGDPQPDAVYLWTKLEGNGAQSGIWFLAEDSLFTQGVQSGTYQTDDSRDRTVLVQANGLAPGTTYYYQFLDQSSNSSVVGRTKTAASQAETNVRLAVASCSSVYSGYFNAYRRIGERNDVDAVIHLGDYIYDFVDEDEEVRVPSPYPTVPSNLNEWRDRHAYYLLDPDLRLARQRHPWIVLWDNHDLDFDSPATLAYSVQAFREYVPMGVPNPNDTTQSYRSFSFGSLIDLIVLDYEQYYHQDSVTNELSAIGTAQRNWLLDQLDNSNAQWRIIANQKMMGRFSTVGIPSQIPFGDGPVSDSSAWDGHNAERTLILDHLTQNNIDNTLVLSGDIHMSFANDLPTDYNNYDDNTGAGSAAVEFLPTSITRGNFDEAGFGGFLATLAQGAISLANPHHLFSELESHGYGILDVRPDRAVGEFWYVEKLQVSNAEAFETAYQVLDGENHWERNALSNPSVYDPFVANTPSIPDLAGQFEAYPQPANQQLNLRFQLTNAQNLQLELLDLSSGKRVYTVQQNRVPASVWQNHIVQTGHLAAGIYLINLIGEQGLHQQKITIQH